MTRRYHSPADIRREVTARHYDGRWILSTPWDAMPLEPATTAGDVVRWLRSCGLSRAETGGAATTRRPRSGSPETCCGGGGGNHPSPASKG